MSYSKLILRDYADIIWPLDDLTSTSSISYAINFFDPSPSAYSASINLNTTSIQNVPMVYGGGTLLQFSSSAIGLSIPAIDRFSELYKDKNSVLSFWMKIDSISSVEQPIFKKRGETNVGLFIKNNYLIFKFGSSANYSITVAPITELDDPHHIVVGAGVGYRSIILDGIEYKMLNNSRSVPSYSASHSLNDVIDFYGPQDGSWQIDSPAFYPNLISANVAKKHYVYGLGKWVDDTIFYGMGGFMYNFSTIETRKLASISWDYPEEWQLTSFNDLEADDLGIGPLSFTQPDLQTFDNNINKSNNSIKFSSSDITLTSYIDVNRVFNYIQNGAHPFFVKFKLDGELPIDQLSQRLISYGTVPDDEIMNIDLYNDSGQYKIRITANNFGGSATFNVNNISSSPDIYIGMRFDGASKFYFAQTGSALQTSSFSYISASGFGLDPLQGQFPPRNNMSLRIGGTLTYDLRFNRPLTPFDFKQFYGTFKKFMVIQPSDISSINSFSDLELYKKVRYAFVYNTNEDRFVISTYGNGSFNIHSAPISEYIDENTNKIGSNIIEIGYPDILSSSNVIFNVTQYDYSGSIQNPTRRLKQRNFLNYLNNTNISGTYLKFDFEIYTDDLLYYPPKIQYFRMETYKSTNNKTVLLDSSGSDYTIYPNSSSMIYLPERKLTPTVFLKQDSGIKLDGNILEFNDQIYPVPLDPRIIGNLYAWVDSRFPTGLRKSRYLDDNGVTEINDLSDEGHVLLQDVQAAKPIYRVQSLNLLTLSQLTGSDNDNTSHISAINSNALSSTLGVINGNRSIEIKPNGTSINSYLNIGNNTASITIYPNQSYTVVGTVTLNRRQTASALHDNARRIVVYTTTNGINSISASSIQPSNTPGTYSLSATFSTSSATTTAFIRYYNGSFSLDDSVYWDNLGLYLTTSSITIGSGGTASFSSPITEWKRPLTGDFDSPTLKFNGNQQLISNINLNKPYTLYIVGRLFKDNGFISGVNDIYPFKIEKGKYYPYSSSVGTSVQNINQYNIYTFMAEENSTKLFINGIKYAEENLSVPNIPSIVIGKGWVTFSILDGGTPSASFTGNADGGLYSTASFSEIYDGGFVSDYANNIYGDINAMLIYSASHNNDTRFKVEKWITESFNMPILLSG